MKYFPLSLIKPLEKEMKERGVSEVARSPRGFLTAYRKAGGRKERLSGWWQNRRDNFVDRHMAQVKKRDEALWDDDGRPSRRHLALIAWAYTPDKARVERYIKRLRKNPSTEILIEPPPNEALRIKELSKVAEQYDDRFNPEFMQDRLDRELAATFLDVLNKNGYDHSLMHLEQEAYGLRPVIKAHKNYFKALRPHELARKHGIPFMHDELATARSPSYPSGHTTQAYYLAMLLSDQFPELQGELFETARKVAESRIDRGVHFPSDNEGGVQLARQLYARKLRTNPKPGSKADDRDQGQRAKPSERIKGSSVNKPGSATAKGSGSIKVSEKTEKALRKKVEDHNEKYGDTPSKRVTYRMLAAVYRRGAGAFSKSHRPGMQRAQWAYARVNHFLKIVRRGYPDDAKYIQDNDLLPKGHKRSTRENPVKQNPFKSQAQRRLFYAKMRDGEISPKVVREWERETGKRKLPERANPAFLSPTAVREHAKHTGRTGKHGTPDFDVSRIKNVRHVRLSVPLAFLDAVEPTDSARIEAYARRETAFPSIIGSYNARSFRRGHPTIYVSNGNHRVAAAVLRGDTHISVIMPEEDWNRWVRRSSRPERANPSRKALDKYKEMHWGIEADSMMRKNDPDLPRELVEMGKLLELIVKPESQEDEYSLQFPEYEKTSLAFSQGKDERLYIILPSKVERALKRDLWQPDAPTVRLGEANKLAGGRHTRFKCPGIQVQVLGRVTHVIYQTQKLDDYKEDGMASRYIHEMGEESGILPYLAIASDGTLWFAGGNYRVLKGGITD